ncbi:hypothetical protein [Nocardia sp. NPDC060249]|uniref:hypothetical protein n=1 Tax=Nocardia sp. NPDC060249 TaxID=3347082 RepID=UPI003649BA19
MRRDHLTVAPLDVDGVWLVYPVVGSRDGEGGDCYEIRSFGDNENQALRYANRHDGYRAVLIKPGQTLIQAVEAMEEADRD